MPIATKDSLADQGLTPGIFSGLCRAARERAGHRPAHMARLLGVHPAVITRIESGRHWVSESTIARYAAALGLEIKIELRVLESDA